MAQLIIFGLAGCLILFLCYVIKYKKQANLISGYDEERVIDKDGYCNWIGNILSLPGIFAIITGVVLWLRPEWALPAAMVFALITITAVIIANVGGKKFMKKV
jgi:hypothetical protein